MTNRDELLTAIIDRYIDYHNSFGHYTEQPIDRAEFDAETAATLKFSAVDDDEFDSANALHLYFDFDTCAVNLLILPHTNHTKLSILISTDCSEYIPMLIGD